MSAESSKQLTCATVESLVTPRGNFFLSNFYSVLQSLESSAKCFQHFNQVTSSVINYFTDIDECKLKQDGCMQTCTNKQGGYTCGCLQHFKLKQDQQTCEGGVHPQKSAG